jgi:ABC-type branched-subunit amino acid transport system substrate-binding protein
MTQQRIRGAVLALACAGASSACTPNPVDRTECSSNADCRSAFSFTWSCEEDSGFCVEEELPARCGKSFPEDLREDPEAYKDYVILGSLYSFSQHNDTLQASELAVRQVNENNGLEGKKYAMLHCDYESDENIDMSDGLNDIAAVELLAPFLADVVGVPAIVGPRGSSRAEATFNAVRDLDVVVMTPSATSPTLTALDNTSPTDEVPGMLWRTAPPDSLQGNVIAADVYDRGITSVAIIYQSGAYGDSLAALFVARFEDLGGQQPVQFPFAQGTDFSSQVASAAEGIRNGEFEEVLFLSSDIADYIAFVNSAVATPDLEEQFTTGLDGGIFFADASRDPQLIEGSTEATQLYAKIRGSRPKSPDSTELNAFAAAYQAAFHEDIGSAFSPHAYDGAWMVIYGTAWSLYQNEEITGLGVAQGLRRLSDGDPPPVPVQPPSWSTVIDQFRNGRRIDIVGASGNLDYDLEIEETTNPIEVWQIVADPENVLGWDFLEITTVEP